MDVYIRGKHVIDTLPTGAVLKALLEALESAGMGCTVIAAYPDRLERVYANEAIAKIQGVDIETMRRMPAIDHVTPEERERLIALRWAIRGGKTPAPPMVETTILRSDGTTVPVELALGHAMIGETRAVFVFASDISAKVEMQAALRESEDRFRRLAETSPDSITVYSGGKYTYANPVALRLFGLESASELATFDAWSVIPKERRDEVTAYVARVQNGEQVPPIVHRIAKPGEKDAYLEASLSFVKIGGAPAIVSWARDITERIRLQTELMKQDRLASVGVLAAGVAHELNNPLASLRMLSRKLCEDADKHGFSPDVRMALEQIDEAGQRMSTIITDLLFMARPVERPQAHVDVEKILTSTVALLRAGISRCPRVIVDLESLPPIHGYPSKLGQVFLNVLRNAVQAVEPISDGEVHIRTHAASDHVEVVIHDNGVGIPREVMASVTQPFFTTKANGTGLGLWISQSLLADHGGGLELTSSPGAGTTVTISLPA